MSPKQPTPGHHEKSSKSVVPGRPYAFVIVLLAAFVVGLTVQSMPISLHPLAGEPSDSTATSNVSTQSTAVESPASSPAQLSSEPSLITPDQLRRLLGISLGLATFSLIPSRRPKSRPETLTAAIIASEAGLPVVGALFPKQEPGQHPSAWTARLLAATVVTCELILCTAFMLTLAACFSEPELFGQFRSNPFLAYAAAVQNIVTTIQSWLQPTLRFV